MDFETLTKLLETGKETVAVRLINDFSVHNEYAHITLQVVHVAKTGNYDTFGFYDNYYGQKHQYRGLKLTCQMDWRQNKTYGFHIGISPKTDLISLEEAETSLKVLRTINRKMLKMIHNEGHTDDFSEYAMRFCRAINAKAFYHNIDGNRAQSINHNIGLLRSELDIAIKTNLATWASRAA